MKENDAEEKNELYDGAPPCKINPFVGCMNRKACKKCGFNPDVSKDRIRKRFGRKYIKYLSW